VRSVAISSGVIVVPVSRYLDQLERQIGRHAAEHLHRLARHVDADAVAGYDRNS
jgi:hypothetical protein